MNKYIAIIIILVIIIAVLAGVLVYLLVARTTPVTISSTSSITIYMVTQGAPTDPFWIPVIEGAEYAAALLGIKVIYEAPSTFSISAMTRLLQGAISAHPSGLILSVPAPSAEVPLINQAYQSGIPMIIINAIPVPSQYPNFPYNETLAYVGQNDYEAGVGLGKYIVSWYEQTHNGQEPTDIVIFNQEPGQFSLTERIAGIDYVLASLGLPNATVVPTSLNYVQSESIIASFLEAHPNTQIIVTLGPAGTDPAIASLNETGLTHKVALFSFGYDNLTLNAIAQGIDIATVDQQPMEQGFLSVVLMYMYVKLGIVPAEYNVSTGPLIVTKSNLYLVEKQNALTSQLSSYLKVGAILPILANKNIPLYQILSMVTVKVIKHGWYYEIIINGDHSNGSSFLPSLEGLSILLGNIYSKDFFNL